MPGEPFTDGAATGERLQDPVGERAAEQRAESLTGVRAPFARLVHHGVAGDQRGPDQSARDGDGVVPRRQRDHDAAWLGHHEVGRRPRTEQALPAVHRPQLGVLRQRARARLDTAEGGGAQLAGLPLVQLRQLVGSRADGGR